MYCQFLKYMRIALNNVAHVPLVIEVTCKCFGFWHRNLHEEPLLSKKIKFKTIFTVRNLLAKLGSFAFFDAHILFKPYILAQNSTPRFHHQ